MGKKVSSQGQSVNSAIKAEFKFKIMSFTFDKSRRKEQNKSNSSNNERNKKSKKVKH